MDVIARFKVPSRHMSGGTEASMKNFDTDSWRPSRDLNHTPPEWKSDALLLESTDKEDDHINTCV